MKSQNNNQSKESLTRATEILQKVWWFSFFIIIAPLTTGVTGFWISFGLFRAGIFVALSFSVLTYAFSVLIFYRAFDKYRDKPFFLNKENNLKARIHIIYLISILSFITTPIFILVSPGNVSFVILPLISFATLYNIVYFYYYYQPIDFYNVTEGEFKHAIKLKMSLRQPYNFILVINYIIHLIFLSLTYFTDLSWVFALITNLIFFIISLTTSWKTCARIKESIKDSKPVLHDLTKFKQNFVLTVTSLMFILLIQLPFVRIVPSLLSGAQVSIFELLNSSYISLVFIVVYIKILFYINFYYSSIFASYIEPEEIEEPKERFSKKEMKYQKYNAITSALIIGFIVAFGLIINAPWVGLVILPFFFIFSYYEQKMKICPKKYNRYILLLNSSAILMFISFGLISELLGINIQFIIFLISFYLILQLFVRKNYFTKENVIIIQNILAVAIFTIIIYSFFPFIIVNYITFTTDPLVILISNLCLHATIILCVLLFSFYILYSRVFYQKRTKLFKFSIFTNIFLIELFIFILINIRVYFLFATLPFTQLLILSSLLFPSIFLIFIFINYIIGIISRKDFLKWSYFLLWLLIGDIFISLFLTFIDNLVLISLDFLFLSIFSQLNLKFGSKIEKVKVNTIKQFVKINSYFIIAELFVLFLFFFYSIILANFGPLYHKVLLSTYFSLLLITFLANILSRNDVLLSHSVIVKINLMILIASAGLAYYYSFLFTINTFYVFLVPFICLFTILFLPLYYIIREEIFENSARKGMLLNYGLLTLSLTLIPSIISVDLIYRLGLTVDTISTLNYTLYLAFGLLLITYSLFRKYKIKEIYGTTILKIQILIEVVLTGTTVFYYIFILLSGMIYSILIPFIAASIFFYLPSIYTLRRRYLKENLIKKIILGNTLVLSGSILLVPIIVGLDLAYRGIIVDWIIIAIVSLVLFFEMLRFLDYTTQKLALVKGEIKFLKLLRIITWLSISILTALVVESYLPVGISISISILIFFILNSYTLKLINNYSKEWKLQRYLREINLYGVTFSISYLIISSIQFSGILSLLPSHLTNLNLMWDIGLFFLIDLLLTRIIGTAIKTKFTRLKISIEFVSWVLFKIILCLFISLIWAYEVLTVIIIFSLIFTFFTPITLSFLDKLKIIPEKYLSNIKKIVVVIFIISSLGLYFDFFDNVMRVMPVISLSLPIPVIVANLFLYLYYCLLRFNKVIESKTHASVFKFYISSIIFILSLLFMNFSFPYVLLTSIPFFLILSRRSIVIIYKFLAYLVLTYSLITTILISTSLLGFYGGISLSIFSRYIQLYLTVLSVVLIFSIWLNIKKNNNLEKFFLYSSFSVLSFLVLNSYTPVPLIYSMTISLFIFLSLMGIYLYRQKNQIYKWFIKPCVLLLIFDFISFISYGVFFNNPTYIRSSPILTFTLTMSITGFAFVFLYNKAPANFRKRSFYFILIAIIICFPTFLYFLIISSNPLLLGNPVPIIIVINVAVFLFYLSIAIYQWRISWAIWKSGWYVWNILPIANWWIIYNSIRGIDVLTNSLRLFGTFELTGSSIVSIIICSLFFLPVIYTKIKKYFLKIVLIVWAESLLLLYWVSQNLFLSDLLLRNLSFVLFSVIVLMPLLMGLKYWKIVSIFWLILTVINATFLLFYLVSIGISLEITISIDILVVGLLLIVYSFFPNIRSIGIALIISYIIVLTGIFLSIYFILYSVIYDPIFSVNISFIVMGFSLFSSKYLKLKNRIIDQLLSWILIFNFSWLTFNTFNLYPGFMIFAFFLAMTVFGCSFFIFNHYRFKFRLNKVIPLTIVAIGASCSLTSLISSLFAVSPYILMSLFSGIFAIFLYFIIVDYRYFLWTIIPIPFSLLLFEYFISFEIVRSIWLLALLSFLITYFIIFQILINLFKSSIKEETEEIKNSMLKIYQDRNQFKIINFISFFLNSLFISLFVSTIFPMLLNQILFSNITFVYHILDFLVVWPVFILLSLKYIEKAEINIKIRDPLLQFNRLCIVIYSVIPIAIAINLMLFMLFNNLNYVLILFSFLLTVSGSLFIESYIVDRGIFYYIFNSIRDKFIFWSWSVFINTLAIFFYYYFFNLNWLLFLVTLSLINQISLNFLSRLDFARNRVSNLRLVLFYVLFGSGSFYLGSLITNGLIFLVPELGGYTYYLLLFQFSFLILYLASYIFIRIDIKLKSKIEITFLTLFQSLLAINWVIAFSIFNLLNLFSIISIILLETCICIKTIKYIDLILFKEKKPEFLTKSISIIIILLYFEISLFVLGLMVGYTGVFVSLLVSQLVFFAFTLLDIYSIKKIKRSYAQLIHSISYIIISLCILFILIQYSELYPILLSVEVLIFIAMQFYTNYSLFASLNQFYPQKTEVLIKWRANLKRILGVCFYLNLCFLLLQALIMLNIEPQLILLSLSIMVHVLMMIDAYLIGFLGKVSDFLKVVSWIMIIGFTMTFIIEFYIKNFISLLITAIPIIILIIIIELAYLFKLLDFWEYITSNKKQIRSVLLGCLYLNFITWPIYYATSEPLRLLNLILFSIGILFMISIVDKYIGVFKEKLLLTLRKFSFLLIGGLLSIDVYLLMDSNPSISFLLTLSVSPLIFVLFLTIIVNPFKRHPALGFSFWLIIFSLLSSTIYQISLSYEISIAFLSFTILLFPFIFMLEKLKELFSKLVDIIVKLFRTIKQAIINAIKSIYLFVKTHFKLIWIPFSAFIALFVGVLLSDIVLHILNPVHSTLIGLSIFGLMYLVIPYAKTSDPDIIFKRRVIRLSIGWGSVIGMLFTIITIEWYIFTVFVSIAVVGTIILVYLRRKEEREKISVKWRFYTLLSLFILLIIFGVLLFLQLSFM